MEACVCERERVCVCVCAHHSHVAAPAPAPAMVCCCRKRRRVAVQGVVDSYDVATLASVAVVSAHDLRPWVLGAEDMNGTAACDRPEKLQGRVWRRLRYIRIPYAMTGDSRACNAKSTWLISLLWLV